MEDKQRMLPQHCLEHTRESSSKRNISYCHLCAIYGLLTLSIVLGMLSVVSLHHLYRRQMNVEMKLGITSSSSSSSSSSGCIYFNSHLPVIDEKREPAQVSEYQVEELLLVEGEEYERRPLTSDGESESKDVLSNNRALSLPESSQRSISDVAWHKSEVPSEQKTPEEEEEVTSVSNGLSSLISESSTTNSSRRGLRRRLSRQVRSREGDSETITVRPQGTRKTRKTPKTRRLGQQQKHENESRVQGGMAAIHLQAPDHMDRQYESGPMVSLNASNTRDTVYRFWRKASWVRDTVDEIFYLDETTGHVTVEVEGVYMVYAQMVYHDLSGRWSFGIYVGDTEKVKCLATEQLRDLHSYHPTSHGVYQSCYTSIVLHVRKNQSVTIRCMYGSRTILTRPEFTFWGMVRLS